MIPFDRIVVHGNPKRGGIEPVIRDVARIARDSGVRVTALPSIPGVKDDEDQQWDVPGTLVISVGGDGTLLGAARRLAGSSTPLWSIHTGSLGFLTEARPEEVGAGLERILRGDYRVQEIPVLVTDVREPAVVHEAVAFNEVAVESSGGHVVTLAIEVDGKPMSRVVGNGVLVASPSGSTAYNLAAGGPVVLNDLDVVVITPICPHALSHRPVIVPNHSVITIRPLTAAGRPRVVADGQEYSHELTEQSVITVRGDGPRVRLVHTSDRHAFDILREKLGWGDPRQWP